MYRYFIILFLLVFGFNSSAQDTLFNLSKLKQIKNAKSVKLENGLTLVYLKSKDSSKYNVRLFTNLPHYVKSEYQSLLSIDAEIRKDKSFNLPSPWTQKSLNNFGVSIMKDEGGYYINCPDNVLDTAMYFFYDLFRKPNITSQDIIKARKNVIKEADSIRNLPSDRIDKITKSIIYGKRHPMLRDVDKVQLNSVNKESYLEFYEEFYKPTNSYLFFQGAISIDSAKKMVDRVFVEWKKKDPPKSSYKLIPIKEPKIVFFDTIPTGKTNIKILFPFALFPFSFNSEQAEVLNVLFQDLLSEKIIDQMQLASKVEGGFESDKITGNYQLNVQLEKDSLNLAIGAIIETISNLREVKYSQQKLDKAKKEIIDKFKKKQTSDQYLSWLIVDAVRNDLQINYYSDFIEGINGLNQSSMRTLAAKYLNYNTALLQIPGKWYPSLHDFIGLSKNFRIELYELDGSLKKVIPKGFNGFSVVDNYINAIGGVKEISKVKDATISYNSIYELPEEQVMLVEGEMKHKSGNRYYSNSRMIRKDKDTVFIHMQIFDGENGLDSTAQRKKRIGGQKLELLKYKSPFVPETEYENWKYSAVLTKADTLDGNYIWIVVMKNPAKQIIIDYYDVDKGIRYKREIRDDNYFNERIIEYSRYRKEDGEGILYPYFKKITTKETIIKMAIRAISYKRIDKKLFEID